MSVIKTIEDGWDCEPLLKEAVEKIEELDHHKYEINNCVRDTDLDYMLVEMIEMMEDAIMILKQIDTDIEYETVDDE